jgi:Zn-dependent protease with chaperone function
MYKFLQIGVVTSYVLLTGFCFLLMLAISGVRISDLIFFITMTGWVLFCFCAVYIRGPLQLFLRGRVRRPTFEEEARLQDCFTEVLRNTGSQKKFRLRIHESDGIEAYACSTNVIAISGPLMNHFTDEELKGVLAHELGHLMSRDLMISWAFGTASDLPRLVGRISSIFGKILWRMTGLLLLTLFFLFLFKPAFVMPLISVTLFLVTFSLLNRLFNWLRLALSRLCEYRQDAFAHQLGFGMGLRNALKKLARMNEQPVNIYYVLMHSTHPVIYNRIRKLEALEGMRD